MERSIDFLSGILATLLILTISLAVGGALIAAVGADPLDALGVVYTGAVGSMSGLSYTLYYATNFIFAGLAFAVAAQAGQYNIGAEGQAYVAGFGVGVFCLSIPGMPWWAALPASVVVATAFGAGWAFIPAVLQVKRGSHLIITTIMFNFLASLLMTYLIVNHLREEDSMITASRFLPETMEIPRAVHLFEPFGVATPDTPLNLSFLMAVAICVLLTWVIFKTRWGYELRAVGKNRQASAFAGIRVDRTTVQAICLSGAIAGFIGVNEVLGAQHRVILELAAGYGFTGIAVALIGANNPLGIIPAALLFGALTQGGASLSFMFPAVSRDVVVVIQGSIILLAGGLTYVLRPVMLRILMAITPSNRQTSVAR
jgi:simple sugar transport system permease protein